MAEIPWRPRNEKDRSRQNAGTNRESRKRKRERAAGRVPEAPLDLFCGHDYDGNAGQSGSELALQRCRVREKTYRQVRSYNKSRFMREKGTSVIVTSVTSRLPAKRSYRHISFYHSYERYSRSWSPVIRNAARVREYVRELRHSYYFCLIVSSGSVRHPQETITIAVHKVFLLKLGATSARHPRASRRQR